jgi:hypothetical protein
VRDTYWPCQYASIINLEAVIISWYCGRNIWVGDQFCGRENPDPQFYCFGDDFDGFYCPFCLITFFNDVRAEVDLYWATHIRNPPQVFPNLQQAIENEDQGWEN